MSLLEVRELSVKRGLLQVVNAVSFDIRAGERVALVGPNGAGKSSLIECLLGILPPAGGSLRAPRIGWVPEGRRVFADLSVRENLLIGADQAARSGRSARERAALWDEVHRVFPLLKERSHQAAGTLSGGQQQMLAIGRAWMSAPELLIVDELSLGLAPLVVAEVFCALDEWVKNAEKKGEKRALLVVEQNARMALRHSDRALVMESGKWVAEGPSSRILEDPDLARTYFGI
jgi:branched-chain amino acid transport system ATP-binding protein